MPDPPRTIEVDPSGDLNLLLESKDKDVTLRVSTKTMCLASPVWKAMCDPGGPWVKQSLDGFTLHLVEDDPEALLTLLNIAHLNFDRLQVEVSYRHLVEISILCDKYDTVKLVRPWISTWLSKVQETHAIFDPGNEEFLFVSWVFGDKDIYEKVSKYLVRSISFDARGKCLNEQMSPLSGNMPPGAIGKPPANLVTNAQADS